MRAVNHRFLKLVNAHNQMKFEQPRTIEFEWAHVCLHLYCPQVVRYCYVQKNAVSHQSLKLKNNDNQRKFVQPQMREFVWVYFSL